MPRDNNLDLVRLLAAFQVVLVHASHHLHQQVVPPAAMEILMCFPGVPIFFLYQWFSDFWCLRKKPLSSALLLETV